MTNYLKIVLPIKNPAFDLVRAGYSAATADKYEKTNLIFRNNYQKSIFALSRLLVAGALYVAIDRMGMNKTVSSLAIGAVSLPALIVYWGGKAVYLGRQTAQRVAKQGLTQELAKGLGLYLIGVQALRYHNLMTGVKSTEYSDETFKQRVTTRYGVLESFLFRKLSVQTQQAACLSNY